MFARAIAYAGITALAAFGQATPVFEVASIKPHPPPIQLVSISTSGTRVTIEANSLTNLVAYAYDLKRYQVIGGPNWAVDDRFDIAAKAEGDIAPTAAQVKQMIQALLADRFQLKVHRETKEMPVYNLVVGKNGPKLKESAPDARPLVRMRDANGMIHLIATSSPMQQLANQFSNANGVDRPVLDKTGLTGMYDFELDWSAGYGAPADGADEISIFTALQEQIGLKLEPAKAPMEVLVIDRAEKPSQN